MALDAVQQITTNHSPLEISESELRLVLHESLKREVINHGGELNDEVTTTAVASLAIVLYGDSNYAGVLLQGDFGCGKTCLMKSAVAALKAVADPFDTGFTDQAAKVCEVNMSDLLLRSNEDMLEDILDADYLFIDDVGWESNFVTAPRIREAQTIVAAAILKRHDEMKPTVLASVFDPINLGDIYGISALDVIVECYRIIELDYDFYKNRKAPRL